MPKENKAKNQTRRPPIVTLLGHVDHGKTSILDRIRQTHLQAYEAGGITQSIGAYQIRHQGQKLTLIDTPGHEAFTAMRARGGQVADLVVLVVAADDGVKPQTIEAINHAKAAGVPILVALNKIDLAGANPEKVMAELAKTGVLTEKQGGEVVAVPVSAKTGQGIPDLLEMILLLAEMQNLTADPKGATAGVVLEGFLEKKEGVLATLIVKNGTLRTGQVIVTPSTYAKVRRLQNSWDKSLKEAGPGTPVQVLGFKEVPLAGENFQAVESEVLARKKLISGGSSEKPPRAGAVTRKSGPGDAKHKVINLIIKANTKGSLEAVHQSLSRLTTQEVELNFIHQGVGDIRATDIMLAATTGAIVLGFRVGIDKAAESAARLEKVIYRTYDIIYHLLEEVADVIEGDEVEEEVARLGLAKILEVFVLSDGTRIAGCQVEEGKIARGHTVRILRGTEILGKSQVVSLRVGKNQVDRVKKGEQCGISLRNPIEFTKGDLIESVQE